MPHVRAADPHRAPTRWVVVGVGARGAAYARHLRDLPARATVVGLASPPHVLRDEVQADLGLRDDQVWDSWEDLAAEPRVADAAVVAVQDRQHHPSALALAERGYDLLLEKPIAPTERECVEVEAAASRAGVRLAICFVLPHAPYWRAMRRALDDGAVGDVVSVDHLEPIGAHHFAHSFVRGAWRREDTSSSLLLAKSCHDIDLVRSMVPDPVTHVSSFGSLHLFRPEHQPAGATDRCTTCPVEPDCTWSAPRFYRRGLDPANAYEHYFTRVVAPTATAADLDQALATGPYGRCVFTADNDVVDHQVVAMSFAGGQTASFTLTAFSAPGHRRTTIFGTRGQLRGDGTTWTVFDHGTQAETPVTVPSSGAGADQGHGGGDPRLVAAVAESFWSGDESLVASAAASVDSHRIVFAAERARLTGTVVALT